MKNKNRIWNIILVLSFLPYHAILVHSVITFFTGCGGGLLNQIPLSGWDAFIETFTWDCIGFSIIPVLPAALIYQLIYLIRWGKGKARA